MKKKKRKKRKIEAMFTRVHLSRERFLVDARTVVYLNIAIEEKRRKNFAASVVSAAWETLLSSKRDSYLREPIARAKFLFF